MTKSDDSDDQEIDEQKYTVRSAVRSKRKRPSLFSRTFNPYLFHIAYPYAMAILQLTVAGIGETVGLAVEDYYDDASKGNDSEEEIKAQTMKLIVMAILIVVLTTWMTYLYTLLQDRKPTEAKHVILKQATEVHIQTDKVYKVVQFKPDLKDGGCQTENKRVRTVKTQSQCKYTYWHVTPRFTPLAGDCHGCEIDEDM